MTVPSDRQTRLEQLLPWVLRAVLLAVPFTFGAQVDGWLEDAAPATGTFATIVVWVSWGSTLAASLLPLPVTLTWLRVHSPAWLVFAIWAAADEADGLLAAVALTATALATALALHPVIGDLFVDGASYGDERRFLLRYPGQLVIGPLQLTWLALVSAVLTGPLLLVTERWIAGVIVALAGAAIAVVCWRALHSLHRRWLVMVPAGFVLHDPTSVREPVLFSRNDVTAIGLASEEFDGHDLSALSLGLSLRAKLRRPAQVHTTNKNGEASQVSEFAFNPTRPGAVLREAKHRRLPIA